MRARSVKNKVQNRSMPPWFVDRTIGIKEYENDRSLTDAEIATIVNWVDGGAPQGNPADMPAQARFADPSEWSLGKPERHSPASAEEVRYANRIRSGLILRAISGLEERKILVYIVNQRIARL